MATRKVTKQEIQATLKMFADRTYQNRNSYAYCAGYYESMLARLIDDLPNKKKIELMSQIARDTPAA